MDWASQYISLSSHVNLNTEWALIHTWRRRMTQMLRKQHHHIRSDQNWPIYRLILDTPINENKKGKMKLLFYSTWHKTGLTSKKTTKGEGCLPHSCQRSQLTVRPRPELRQDAGFELHLNSSSYPQVCLFLTFRENNVDRLSRPSNILKTFTEL